MSNFVVPKASVLEVVKNGGKLAFNRGSALTGRLVEQQIGNVIVVATRETIGQTEDEKMTFAAFCDKIRTVVVHRAAVKAGAKANGMTEEAWEKVMAKNVAAEEKVFWREEMPPSKTYCHYHKGEVGHTIDNCPNVRCRGCGFLGHTDKVCTTPKCETCEKFGHVTENCYSTMKCETCGRTGHPTEKCRGTKVEKRPVWCAYHQIEGEHSSAKCPDLMAWDCENCGEKGHFFKNCHNAHIVRPLRAVSTHDDREYIVASGGALPLGRRTKK